MSRVKRALLSAQRGMHRPDQGEPMSTVKRALLSAPREGCTVQTRESR